MPKCLLPQRPVLKTPLPGPKAAAWIARDERIISRSYTRIYPLVAAWGEGAMLEDADGNVFLDFTSGIAVTSTGHAHPAVSRAIADQAERLIHMSGTDFYYAPEIELAERLARHAPWQGDSRVFFCNSGAESIEAALKLARYHTRRQRIVSFVGAFHGRTYGAMSIGGSKAYHQRGFGPMLGGVHRVRYDCREDELRELFATSCPADEVAAIVVEPIQGEGGYRVPSADFLPMLRRVCDEHGILLVVDEVQSGMGRTGRMFAIEHFGVVPNVICLAKGIASGLPLGAILTPAEVMDWPPGSHASTFGGNPVSCRAALATLDLIEGGMMANAIERGAELRELLAQAAARETTIGNIRGVGLMLAFDTIGPDGPSGKLRDAIIQAAFQRGLLLLGCGAAGVRLCPALCVTSDHARVATEIIVAACADCREQA